MSSFAKLEFILQGCCAKTCQWQESGRSVMGEGGENPSKRVSLLLVLFVQKAREIWQSQRTPGLQINGSEVDFLYDFLQIG